MTQRILRSLFVLFCLATASLSAQSLTKSAIQVDPGNTKLAGATFGYRLAYNCSSTSGPCLNAEIIDLLPIELDDSAGSVTTTPASPTGNIAAIQITHNYMGSGRTRVRFQLISPLPAGASGDMIINVRFPNGSTPDGTVATNTADGINLETTPGTVTTPPVNVTAVANPDVDLDKNVTSTPLNLDMPETYQLLIGVGGGNGTLRLDSIGPVVDTLPPGTVFNGATPAADCQPGCVGTTPATVTWTSPCTTPLNPGQTCNISVNVTFPSATFPSGTNVTNSFTVDATPLGEPPQTFGPVGDTSPVTTFVPAPSATVVKDMASNTPNPPTLNQTFSYSFAASNNGNVALDNMVVIDTLPVEMTVTSVTTGAYNGFSDFAPGVGVRVSYEKNTAPAVFTLWGSSPNTTTSTTLTAPPPGLGAGEYITRIRWEYGQAAPAASTSTRPLITGQIINPDNAGGPVAFGDSINNCLDLTAVYTAGPTNVNVNNCQPFTLSGPFVQLNPAKDNLSGGGPFNPGQAVAFRLRVRSAPQSSDPVPLEDLSAADLLPVDLIFGSWTFDDQGTGLPAPQNFSQIPNFAGTGRTLLRWSWNAGSGNLGVNQQVFININTTIREGAIFGPLSNDFQLDTDSPGLQQRCSGSSQTDTLDFDGDGDTAETLCRESEAITVAGIANLDAVKTIKGTCDGGAVAASAGTLIGGGIEYHLRVTNSGTMPMQNFVLIDILPFVGDTGVRDTSPRGSQWSPLLAAPIVPPPGTTLYYSTSGNPCRGEVGGPTTGCDPPNWTTVAPTPITSVRSFKLEFGDRVVNPADFIEFTFTMTTPGDIVPGTFAYNSFAYYADRADGLGSLNAEPEKVGITIGSCDAASLGDFVWIDVNDDGIQNDGPTGLNGVTMTLLTPGVDGIPGNLDDVPLTSTITADGPDSAPGWYRFPGLAPGDYFVHMEKPPTYELSPSNTTADANDSDPDPTGASHVTNLSANEDDPTIDFGLVPTELAALGDYVWFDYNSDGIQNEPVTAGINGATVHLHLDDGDGTQEPGGDDLLVATTVTADDTFGRPGYYLFDGLAPGLPYYVQFVTPASATNPTTDNAGGDDTVDSDADPTDGTTAIVTLAPSEVNRTLDAGFIIPTGTLALGDQVWFESDNDGLFEPENGETGVDDVRLDLYSDVDADGEPTLDEFAGSTTTATTSGFAGRYRFNDLAPGSYIVVVSPNNFNGGGALFGRSTSTGNDPAPDPDDDANGDDNGTDIGALVASHPVTLTDNGEPTSEDGNNDTNLTVDFGFILASVVPPPPFDYGDAPDVGAGTATNDYNTTALDNGPRHLLGVASAPWLGTCVDSDGGFHQGLGADQDDLNPGAATFGTCADSDDENGVTFSGSFTPGSTANFSVTSGGSVPCVLDAWIDWDQSGEFGDLGNEVIASSMNIPLGPATVIPANVPTEALPGTTYARFRCSTAGSLDPVGAAADGEVEDYAVTIIGEDFGDDPASYGDASHLVDPLTPLYLGSCVDTETASQPNVGANGDDDNPGISRVGSCFDDESGVVFTTGISQCITSSVTITSNTAGILDAWIDFNADGDFGDAGEQIFVGQVLVAGANPLTFNVPCAAVTGATYSRFRLTSTGGTTPTGSAPDGEVEDYALLIGPTDFGDAPDTYTTTFATDGARHLIITGFTLGATIDGEPDGQPSVGAIGDGADEDGATMPARLVACESINIPVALTNTAGIATPLLDAWIDFNGNGSFDAGDRIATSLALSAGVNNVPVNVPCNAATVASYARFRLSSAGVAGPSSFAVDGEIEDYAIAINGLDLGDAPDPTFPTLLASNGARHPVLVTNNPTLGAIVDTEADGAPSAGATGDDTTTSDDEDGVTFPAPLIAGVSGDMQITTGATGGAVSVWIDFNNDGDWGDAGEQVLTDQALGASASQTFPVAVPNDAFIGTVNLRARISSQTGLGVTGAATDGEIEDHQVVIDPQDPVIGVALQLITNTFTGICGVHDLEFEVTLSNLGNVTLTNVQATTPLDTAFVPPATFTVTSISSTDLTVDATYNGSSNPNMLLAGATLLPGQTARIRFTVNLHAPCRDITYEITTTGTGEPPSGPPVTDTSQDGGDPDPDNDDDPSDNGDPTPVVITAVLGIPTLDPRALIGVAVLLALVALRKLT